MKKKNVKNKYRNHVFQFFNKNNKNKNKQKVIKLYFNL